MLVLSACREMVACAKSHPALGEALSFSRGNNKMIICIISVCEMEICCVPVNLFFSNRCL